MIDHKHVAKLRRQNPTFPWGDIALLAGYDGDPQTLGRKHREWQARRGGEKLPSALARWHEPLAGGERAYTHGALWCRIERPQMRLYAGLDFHAGTAYHNSRTVEALVQRVGDEKAYMVIPGDALDNALAGKHGGADQSLPLKLALRQLEEVLWPVRNRIIAAVGGNHGHWSDRHGQLDPEEYLAERLGVPYSPGPMLIRLIVGGRGRTVYLGHGRGGGQAPGYVRAYALRPFMRGGGIGADVAIQGHIHIPHAAELETWDLDPRTGRRERQVRIGLVAGSAHEYGGYVERLELQPVGAGTAWVEMGDGLSGGTVGL